MQDCRQFLKVFFGLTFGISSVISAVNWKVDPLGYFGNNQKGAYAFTEREFKRSKINSIPHDALLLGSSVTSYIDPDAIKNYTFFNASFSNALPEEILDYLNENAHENLRLVVIGLDIQTLNEHQNPIQKIENKNVLFEEILMNLYSSNVFQKSIDVLVNDLDSDPSNLVILEDGQRNPIDKNRKDILLDTYEYGYSMMLMQKSISSFKYPKERMKILAEIKELLETREIPYIVFLNPLNRQVIKHFQSMPSHRNYQKLKADLNKLFPSFYDFTESKYSARTYFYKHDVIHYKPATGNKLLNTILTKYHSEKE